MKTAIVLSDTHGYKQWMNKLKPLFAENDYIIHLGDGNRDMQEVFSLYPEKTYVCQGNCDYETAYSRLTWEIRMENCKIFFAHGHKFGVKQGLYDLKTETETRGCCVALYGHTHIAAIDKKEGVTLINPGAAGLYTSSPSYAYLVVNEDKITATIVPFA